MKWFIHSNGRQEGPLFLEEIKKRISEGKVNEDTHVWQPGMPSWKKLREVPELMALFTEATSSDALQAEVPPSLAGSQPPVRVDELSVFTELPKAASEAPPKLPGKQSAKLGKEAKKAQKIERRTESFKSSKQALPRVAILVGVVALFSAGAFVTLSLTKRDLDPIPGISSEEFSRLKAVALAPATEGKKVAFAPTTDDLAHPRFHVASNLPNGTKFDVVLKGVPGTLVKPFSQPAAIQTSPLKRFHASTDRLELPKGEYQVQVMASGEAEVLATGTYFLGGAKDADYENSMSQAKAQKRQKAETEIQSIHEAVNLLTSFQDYLVVFEAQMTPGKQPDQRKVRETQKQWDEFERSLSQKSFVWQEAATSEFVLSRLVQLARETWQNARQADRLFSEYFLKTSVGNEDELNRMRDAIRAQLAKFRDSMVGLKAEVDRTHVQDL
jgi:cell fate (sporulation/competence/biofilm development) regulator YlbF (YheA/YmcA/DUF963 family)